VRQLGTGRSYYYHARDGEPFSSLDELEGIVLQLDVADEVALYYEEPDGPNQLVKGHKGIYNTNTRQIASIVSDNYAIIQHRDAYISLVSALRRAEIEVAGVVKNGRDHVAVEMTFDGVVADDGEQGIELGAKVVNSYNKQSAFRGWGWGLRKVCSNGLYIRTIIPEMAFSIVHRGKAPEISIEAITNMVDQARSRLVDYEHVIERAKETPLAFPMVESIIETISPYVGGTRSAVTVVDGYWNGELNTTRWDAYNMMTAYASHEGLNEPRFHAVQQRAEKFLMADTIEIVVPEDAGVIEASEV